MNCGFNRMRALVCASNAWLQLLHEMFDENIISQRCTLIWPPRSPDLSLPDFSLWGYLKKRVYINNSQTIENLKQTIRQEIDTSSQEVLSSVMNAVVKRAQLEINAGGRHLKSVAFHITHNLHKCNRS